MKKTKISLAIVLSMVLFGVFSTGVFASGYGQDSTCTGAYGQVTDCDAVKGATTSSKVIYADEVELADTALDTPTLLAAIATISSGAGAFFLKKKIA
jgi:hypothetical protein